MCLVAISLCRNLVQGELLRLPTQSLLIPQKVYNDVKEKRRVSPHRRQNTSRSEKASIQPRWTSHKRYGL